MIPPSIRIASKRNLVHTRRLKSLASIAFLLAACPMACLRPADAQSANSQNQSLVLKLTLRDTIQPITAGYLERGLAEAGRRHADAVLIDMSTPGGLLDSTRQMVEAIEHSPAPVIIFIAPTGSRAGSAGFFLLESADIAAMAPGTNAGAAHPVLESPTGGSAEKSVDPVMKQKIENDAAAFLRSYVSRRGRNVAAAEDAVRNSKSYTDTEALNLKLIDLIEPNDGALLAVLDGRTITRFDGSQTTLRLRNAVIQPLPPTLREQLLGRLMDPNLAVLLLLLGGLLIYLEFNTPGTIVPGAIGTLLVLLAFFALDLLPIHGASVLLLIAAMVLLVLEAKFSSHGILALTGTVSLVFGLLTLVDGPIPEMRVHPGTAIATGIAFGSITFFLAFVALKARRAKLRMGPQAMIDEIAIAQTALAPQGQVLVRGEIWQATLSTGISSAPLETAPAGSSVRVIAIRGLQLLVEPLARN